MFDARKIKLYNNYNNKSYLGGDRDETKNNCRQAGPYLSEVVSCKKFEWNSRNIFEIPVGDIRGENILQII